MQYALLVYAPHDDTEPGDTAPEDTDRARRPMPGTLAALLDQPHVTGWTRLHADESATTLRNGDGQALLTDGPFIDSKEYLAGLIQIEAANLDEALAIAGVLVQETKPGSAIEVRPVLGERSRGA
jgi:hypothetical protein